MNWNVGDIALWYGRPIRAPIGTEVEITRIGVPEPGQDCYIYVPGVPSPHPGGIWSCRFAHLKKLPPPNNLSTWDEGVFKPRVLERI
jgi:hypothetical protein